jgi:hypothetical protein
VNVATLLACVVPQHDSRPETTQASAFSRKVIVNVAADFTSVVPAGRLVRFHDGCKIRRYIHKFVS